MRGTPVEGRVGVPDPKYGGWLGLIKKGSACDHDERAKLPA